MNRIDDDTETIRYSTFDAPGDVGALTILARGDALVGLRFAKHRHEAWAIDDAWARDDDDALIVDARSQVTAYFAGARRAFDLPLAPVGTAFQQRVWAALREIPFGETISYGTLARRIGNADASRAVGLANGRNPIALVIPCHRVIGANGSLTGFGGGVDVKHALMRHEGALL